MQTHVRDLLPRNLHVKQNTYNTRRFETRVSNIQNYDKQE
jgi:hypothetical protein